MKRSILIIFFSIFIASLFLPGGYGSWTDELTIKGKIAIVKTSTALVPMLVPIPVPNTIPVLEGTIPAIDDIRRSTPPGYPDAVGDGTPDSPEPDSTQQDNSSVAEKNAEAGTDQQEQTDTGDMTGNDAVPENSEPAAGTEEEENEVEQDQAGESEGTVNDNEPVDTEETGQSEISGDSEETTEIEPDNPEEGSNETKQGDTEDRREEPSNTANTGNSINEPQQENYSEENPD